MRDRGRTRKGQAPCLSVMVIRSLPARPMTASTPRALTSLITLFSDLIPAIGRFVTMSPTLRQTPPRVLPSPTETSS